jgi:hypothetical protein
MMVAFSVRFVFENPSLATPELRAFYSEACDVYKIGDISRSEFLEVALETLKRRLTFVALFGRAAYSFSPPRGKPQPDPTPSDFI